MVAPEARSNGHSRWPDMGEENRDRTQPSGPHPLEPLLEHLAALRGHVDHYVQATADSLRLTARQIVVRIALGCLASTVGIAALVTATVLVLNGAAGGIAAALNGRMWAGQLIVGLSLLLLVAVACWLGVRQLTKTSRSKTIDKYERQYHRQSARHDASGREAETF
jgi:hypothetical protein